MPSMNYLKNIWQVMHQKNKFVNMEVILSEFLTLALATLADIKYEKRMIKLIFQESMFKTIFIIILLFVALYLYNEHISTDYKQSRAVQMRMSVIKTLGGPCMPIIAQCCTSRNLSEGIYARRSDMPGGFCFHSDCDIVHMDKLYSEARYTIK